jgi:K+-sensing histidine kinase KdpD
MKSSLLRRIPGMALAFLAAGTSTLLASAISLAAFGPRQLADAVMLYLLGVVLVSLRFGYGPSLLAAVLSVLCFDFFFIPPLYTLAIHDLSHVVTFGVMFLVALLVSGLTQRARASAIERADLASEARRAQLQMEAEQMRSSLLSSVSHDLRTPLAVVTGAASSLLEDTIDAATRRELTETIFQEAQRLNRLVRDILDMTRLEAGAVRVNKEWQPLEEVVGAALNRLEDALVGRQVLTNLPADLPLVPLDAVLIEQLLLNLLENALKYTAADTPLEIRAHAQLGGVEILVADRGPGIPEAEQRLIFDKFYRMNAAPGGGAGLGLAICKAIVAAHGGQISVDGRVGGGAEFHIYLPVEGEPPPPEAPDPEPEL